ncbi:Serine/threonine-protein phosphatase 7 long form homolog [Linum perenne]
MTHTCSHSKKTVDYDPRFETILYHIGLYQLRDALRLTPDSETNTFHLCHSEATITLVDMHFITNLTVDGLAVTTTTPIPTRAEALQDYVERLLGKRPTTADLSSRRIKMSWLRNNFTYMEGAISDNDIVTIYQYCRANIMDFFGSCVFDDRFGSCVQFFFLPLLEDLERVGYYAWGRTQYCPSDS